MEYHNTLFNKMLSNRKHQNIHKHYFQHSAIDPFQLYQETLPKMTNKMIHILTIEKYLS